jgi:hypothetical protein
MKKVIIALLFIGLIGIVILILSNTPQKGSNSTVLSDRSKEFLEKQRKEGKLDFAGVNAKGGEEERIAGSEVIDIDRCFSISIPFPIESNKDMGECFNQIIITRPRGMVNVYQRTVSYASFDDDSGVKLRRGDPKLYKEEKKQVDGKQFLVFKKTDAGYEKTALYLNRGKLTGVVLLANINDDSLDEKFDEMIDSIDLSN